MIEILTTLTQVQIDHVTGNWDVYVGEKKHSTKQFNAIHVNEVFIAPSRYFNGGPAQQRATQAALHVVWMKAKMSPAGWNVLIHVWMRLISLPVYSPMRIKQNLTSNSAIRNKFGILSSLHDVDSRIKEIVDNQLMQSLHINCFSCLISPTALRPPPSPSLSHAAYPRAAMSSFLPAPLGPLQSVQTRVGGHDINGLKKRQSRWFSENELSTTLLISEQ